MQNLSQHFSDNFESDNQKKLFIHNLLKDIGSQSSTKKHEPSEEILDALTGAEVSSKDGDKHHVAFRACLQVEPVLILNSTRNSRNFLHRFQMTPRPET